MGEYYGCSAWMLLLGSMMKTIMGKFHKRIQITIAQFYCGLLENFDLTPHTNTTDAPTVMEVCRGIIERAM